MFNIKNIMFYTGFLLINIIPGCSSNTSSSSDETCKKTADCDDGLICINYKCVDDPFGINKETDSDTDKDSDISSDTHTGDSESDSNSDSETAPSCTSQGTVADGELCQSDCDCVSLHCENGFCCSDGECCSNALDCKNDLCSTAVCITSGCKYTSENFQCGDEDITGSLCTNGSVCDGDGGCVELTVSDCGYYNSKQQYVCGDNDAVLVCYESCTALNEKDACTSDAACVDGKCISKILVADGEICTADSDCISNHCGDGFCCSGGECCSLSSDCDDTCKSTVQCGTDFKCYASFSGCGYEDVTGDLCTGENRCDGQGSCVDVETCAESGTLFEFKNSYSCLAGFAAEDCYDTCIDNNSCTQNSVCDNGQCVLVDGSLCTQNSQCSSGYCNNGRCCSGGTCCASDSECETPCTTGEVCNKDLFTCEVTGSNELCGSQPEGCGDNNRCDGKGNCVGVTDYCNGTGDDSFTCSENSVVMDCRCNVDDDCDLDDDFCNGTYKCGADNHCKFDIFIAACPDSSSCFDNVQCDEATSTCTGEDPCEALSTACDMKICLDDGAGGYICNSNPFPDTTLCDDGDVCNGNNDRCLSGVCTHGSPNQYYCFDSNPCTEDICNLDGEGAPQCDNTPLAVGEACSTEYSCFGDNATCQLDSIGTGTECIAVNALCQKNGICSVYECEEDFSSATGKCSDSPNYNYLSIECGQEITLTPGDFATRVYSDYTGENDLDSDSATGCESPTGEPFIGKEALLYIDADSVTDNTANLEIISVIPVNYGIIDFLLFEDADVCDWATCTTRQENGFADLALNAGMLSPEIVLDSRDEVWPPDSLTLKLNCTPK
ncbi:MAG: hypothetical protein JXR91_00840 [Deltaproteobacteria bacterium]|nr:hypothetical protein [Deltaproteobacteria bacterium]